MKNISQEPSLSKTNPSKKFKLLDIRVLLLIFLLGLFSGVVLVILSGFGVSFLGKTILSGKNGKVQVSSSLQGGLKPGNLSGSEGLLENVKEEDQTEVLAYLKFKKIQASFFPTGVPDVYGDELDISFDKVQEAINKVRVFDPTYGDEGKKIVLTDGDLERYINIGSQTACKYCCGATTLVRKDGEAACGCAHSQMMRGLAAYLIKNHPELSDEQILNELNTWRITYFPKQTLSEKLAEMEKAGEPGIKEILEEFPDFLPQMVGGC